MAIRGARFGAAGMHAARQVCHEYALRLEGLLGLRSVPATVAMPPPQNARAPATVCRTGMQHVTPTEESSSVVGGITDTVYLTDEPSSSVVGSVTDAIHLTDESTAGRAPTNHPPGSAQPVPDDRRNSQDARLHFAPPPIIQPAAQRDKREVWLNSLPQCNIAREEWLESLPQCTRCGDPYYASRKHRAKVQANPELDLGTCYRCQDSGPRASAFNYRKPKPRAAPKTPKPRAAPKTPKPRAALKFPKPAGEGAAVKVAGEGAAVNGADAAAV